MRTTFAWALGVFLTGVSLGARADAPVSVTFMGFQRFEDQSSRIFVHVSKKPSLLVEEEEVKAVFTLHDAHILVKNNKNPLDLSHFETPVKEARLVQRAEDVELVIELKRKARLLHRFSDNSDGSVSLQVDFPATPPQ